MITELRFKKFDNKKSVSVSGLFKLYFNKPGSLERFVTKAKTIYNKDYKDEEAFLTSSKIRVLNTLLDSVIEIFCDEEGYPDPDSH